jgi:DNA polymerase III delta subunit
MIILLHGDHIESSRAELNKLRAEAKDREVRRVEGRGLDTAMLIQSLESSSLFGGSTLIIVEQLFGKLGRQLKKISEYAAIISKAGDESDIILWEDRELSPGAIKQLGAKAQIKLFKMPVLIFQFLDSIQPNSSKIMVNLFEKLTQSEAPELVFAMLIKRVRQLISIHAGQSPSGLAPWQVGRLTTQAKGFTMDELVLLYKKLGDAEYGLKSGTSPFTFGQALEQVLISV